ncbi:hypothetical protein [Sphingomonas sp.]|uniref:hypothetical protein n=1 Tax=Sphingomonas sp. TaxID=28214 RepID=UPI001E0F2ED9|nr:hypothetical protein [Sphingomonas sp.]MBX9795920.1 hypothetical protein [Sphingomonas sp.]
MAGLKLDRVGLALGAGGVASGLGWVLLAALGGNGPLALLMVLIVGTLGTMLGTAMLALPLWIALSRAGYRGPVAAALLGAGLGFLIFLFAQTQGFGLAAAPGAGAGAAAMRWASGAAVALVLAVPGAGIALLMWWVGYRG